MSLRIGWFTSGRGDGSRAMFEHVLESCQSGAISAQIDFVFMHREKGDGVGSDALINRVNELGIPLSTLSSKQFRATHEGDFAGHRDEFDREVISSISSYSVDILVMAGYLLIASPTLFESYRLLNLHPALPDGPKGLWQQVIWQLIDERGTKSGLTTFIVSSDLDRGRPISWAEYPIRGGHFDALWEGIGDSSAEDIMTTQGRNSPLFQAIREAGLQREPHLLTETLRVISDSQSAWESSNWQSRNLTREINNTVGDTSCWRQA